MERERPHPRSVPRLEPGASGFAEDNPPALLPLLPPGPARMRILAVAAGLLGSLIGWYAAELASQVLRWEVRIPPNPQRALTLTVGLPSDLTVVAQNRADTRNTALAMSVPGAVLGLVLGIAGGWSRGSRASAAAAGGLGVLLGLVIGAVVPLLVCPIFFSTRPRPPDPMRPLLAHIALYGGISAVAGLAFGQGYLGRAGAWRGFCAAALGSLAGVMFYGLLHTLWFPLEPDFSPLPVTPLSRLLAILCVALVVTICLAAVLSGPQEPAATPRNRDPGA